MSLNDNSLALNKAVDIPVGVANPTPSSVYGNPQKDNGVMDPPSETSEASSKSTDSATSSLPSAETVSNTASSLLKEATDVVKSAYENVTKE